MPITSPVARPIKKEEGGGGKKKGRNLCLSTLKVGGNRKSRTSLGRSRCQFSEGGGGGERKK